MGLKRRRVRHLPPDDLIRRVAKLSNQELIDNLDVTLSSITRYVPEYRRTGAQTLLVEISLLAEALYVLADVLKDRQIELLSNTIAAARQMRSRP